MRAPTSVPIAGSALRRIAATRVPNAASSCHERTTTEYGAPAILTSTGVARYEPGRSASTYAPKTAGALRATLVNAWVPPGPFEGPVSLLPKVSIRKSAGTVTLTLLPGVSGVPTAHTGNVAIAVPIRMSRSGAPPVSTRSNVSFSASDRPLRSFEPKATETSVRAAVRDVTRTVGWAVDPVGGATVKRVASGRKPSTTWSKK